MARKIWKTRDIIGTEDAQRWEDKADLAHRHKVSDIDGLPEAVDEITRQKADKADVTAHIQARNNPHAVTKSQVGLSNVTNDKQFTYTEGERLRTDVSEHEERLALLEYMLLQNDLTLPIVADDSVGALLVDSDGVAIVADWKYTEIGGVNR